MSVKVAQTPVINHNGSVHHLTNESWLLPLVHYAAWLHAGHRSTKTIGLRMAHLRQFARATGLEPYAATFDALTAYLASRTWSATTRHSIRSSLRSFYGWAMAAGHLPADPTALLPTITPDRGRPRPAPEAAVQVALFSTDIRVRLMVELGASAGMRIGEICQVHTDDLREDLYGVSILVHGKGGKLRMVPLNDRLSVTMRNLPSGYLFPGQENGHLSASYCSKLVSAALPDGWTAHTLRHRFASVAYRAERDIRAVQELLGHASVATTQIYTEVPDDALRRAVAAAGVFA